ncbi:MAG TPA: hypothetical protein VFZ21_00325 [Gemmatimonadaceae bacterium]|jgi:hypothetical protein|nr:hypothetical protein [Gemmatimonadaceae bacterium]
MARHAYLDVVHQALHAELIQWGGAETVGSSRRSARALAALVFGASTVVAGTNSPAVTPTVPPAAPSTREGSRAILPARPRPATDRLETIGQVLVHAQTRVESGSHAPRLVATLALEIGRLQRDLMLRSPDGMEECVGEAYAALEAVRRAVADVVVDLEDVGTVAATLDRAAQLVGAA